MPPISGGRHPNLLDAAGSLDFAQGEGCLGLDADRRRDFPRPSQIARGAFARALRGHAGFALFAREIFGLIERDFAFDTR